MTSRYTCPSCGFTTADEELTDEISVRTHVCPECGWEAFQADFTEDAS